MTDNNLFSQYQELIDKLEKKNFKSRNLKLSEDPDFKKLCDEFRECVQFQRGNYDSFVELKKKFEKLATAYCMEVDLSTPLD